MNAPKDTVAAAADAAEQSNPRRKTKNEIREEDRKRGRGILPTAFIFRFRLSGEKVPIQRRVPAFYESTIKNFALTLSNLANLDVILLK